MFVLLPVLRVAILILGISNLVAGLGSTCSSPLGAGTSGPNDPFWMETIKHQGKAPFNSNPNGYKVFRNVKVGRILCSIGCFPLTIYPRTMEPSVMGFTTTLRLSSWIFFSFELSFSLLTGRLPAPQSLTRDDVEVDHVNLQRTEFMMLHDNKLIIFSESRPP